MLDSKENYKFGLGVKGLSSIFAILFSRVENILNILNKLQFSRPHMKCKM